MGVCPGLFLFFFIFVTEFYAIHIYEVVTTQQAGDSSTHPSISGVQDKG